MEKTSISLIEKGRHIYTDIRNINVSTIQHARNITPIQFIQHALIQHVHTTRS